MAQGDREQDAGVLRGFDPWRHRFTLLVAASTVALLLAGGLVTSTGSGLAVPDWPLSFGRVFPPMEGGVLYEHGHRLVAASVGLLTIALAAWFQARERRAWVRRLALLAVLAVTLQGLLGGLTVLLRLPTAVSVAHACLGQAFFCLLVVMAHATSRGAVLRSARPDAAMRDGAGVRCAGLVATGLTFGQLIVGAIVRHTGAGLAIPDFPLSFGRLLPPVLSFEIGIHFAHRVGAVMVAGAVIPLAVKAVRLRVSRPELAAPALLCLVLLAAQILLGALSVWTRLAVLPATLHLVGGALLMAACLVLTLRSWRVTQGLRAGAAGSALSADPVRSA
ncbi:MAG: heme A synthase [Acidobacteriota bacterium]